MTLKEHQLYAKLSKCEFWLKEVIFLGHTILAEGILVDPRKVEAVWNWERPTIITEIHIFLGFTEYYRRFIEEFSTIAILMTRLTQKEIKWEWTQECFQELKKRLTTAPVLTLPLRTE
jgi:hypothetical protein